MFKLKLTPIIIGSLIISAVILIVLVGSRSQPSPTTSSPPSPTPHPTPASITNFSPDFSVSNVPPAPSVQTAAHFVLKPADPQKIVDQLTQRFNLGPPQFTQFPDNTTKYSFQNDQTSLAYYPEENRISYFNAAILTSSTPLPNTLLEQAQAFIAQHFPTADPITISLVNTTYLKANNTVAKPVISPSQANLIQYDFRYTLSGAPLYQSPYALTDISIILNADGVRSATIKVLPTITPTNQQDPLITPEQMRLKLSQKQFILIKVNNQQYAEAGPLLNIAQMRATSTTIGYVISNNTIVPYYIIFGTAANANNPQITYQVEVAVSATNL